MNADDQPPAPPPDLATRLGFAPRRPADRPLRPRRRMIVAGAALAITALVLLLGQSSTLVEGAYVGLGHWLQRGLSHATALLPTSLAELAVILALTWGAALALPTAWHVIRRRRGLRNALACGALRLIVFAAIVTATFYPVWGLNYLRDPWLQRQGWQQHAAPPADAQAQARELAELCRALVHATNAEYERAMGSDDAGIPSAPLAGMAALDESLERAYAVLAADLGAGDGFAAPRGRAKPLALSPVMPWLRVAGFYFPWTGEANYCRVAPACTTPFVVAHEKAHQRGIAGEDEANFFGFAACIRADDPYARYSGYLFAQRQLLWELSRMDAVTARELIALRSPGVQRDIDDLRAFYAAYTRGVAAAVGTVSTGVNNAYLRLNRVEGGVRNYDMSSTLIVAYARATGAIVHRP